MEITNEGILKTANSKPPKRGKIAPSEEKAIETIVNTLEVSSEANNWKCFIVEVQVYTRFRTTFERYLKKFNFVTKENKTFQWARESDTSYKVWRQS